jgi:hypothetical protein
MALHIPLKKNYCLRHFLKLKIWKKCDLLETLITTILHKHCRLGSIVYLTRGNKKVQHPSWIIAPARAATQFSTLKSAGVKDHKDKKKEKEKRINK